MNEKITKAINEIQRGTTEIIGLSYIYELVERYYKTNKRFIVKAGFDPTAPDLHLGHTVLLQKLSIFQKHGGDVKFLIGDFTAMIGDPSGRNKTRQILSKDEVLKNARTYREQVLKILDEKHTEICFNSQWLEKLNSAELLNLTSKFTVARMIERDDFNKRYKESLPISIVEFIYPLLQGYDSVVMECDIECGGNDQKFNLLVGRDMQYAYGLNKQQSVLMMPLLEGTDGRNKMSKSLNNYIGINENANEIYAKIMSIPDSIMWKYYELLSNISLDNLLQMKQDLNLNKLHPKIAKENLALEIATKYHNKQAANEAKERFNLIFSSNSIPNDIEEFNAKENDWICKILVDKRILKSSSEARRSIKAGALKINGQKILDENLKLKSGIYTIQVGKRKFLKVFVNE